MNAHQTSPPLSTGRRRRRHKFSPDIVRQLKPLARVRDNVHGPLAALEDIAVISGAVALSTISPYLYPVSVIIIGTRQRALATLLHEASHRTLCKNRTLNDTLGMCSGWAIFQSLHRYHDSHVDEHHVHLGDQALDPDTRNYVEQGLFETDPKRFYRKHLLPLALGLKAPRNLLNLVRDRLVPKKWRSLARNEKREYISFLVLWASVVGLSVLTGCWTKLLLFWIVPYFSSFQGINWLIEVAEHFPLIRLFDFELEMTRNRRGGAIENGLTGIHGESWHLVHHLWPGIPFWKLAEAHKIMMQDEAYAVSSTKSGGLFVKGPKGEPSIIAILGDQLSLVSASRGL